MVVRLAALSSDMLQKQTADSGQSAVKASKQQITARRKEVLRQCIAYLEHSGDSPEAQKEKTDTLSGGGGKGEGRDAADSEGHFQGPSQDTQSRFPGGKLMD